MLKKRLLVPILLIGAGMLLMGFYSLASAGSGGTSSTGNEQEIQVSNDATEEAEEELTEAENENPEDENLPGGGHEDEPGVDVDHQFEGEE